jgi:hypothetical protein
LCACLRKAEVLNLALLDQVLHGSRYVFDRHVRIKTVLIGQIDDIDLEPLERGVGDLLDVLESAVSASAATQWLAAQLNNPVEMGDPIVRFHEAEWGGWCGGELVSSVS